MTPVDRPPQEEIERLFEEYARTGRRRVRNQLVEAHIGFAHHVAARYRDRGMADEDLRQTAFLALVKAVDRFDPTVGVAFTSFAGPTIEGEIKRLFRDSAWSVRVPRSTKEMHLLVRAATDELGQELGRSPTVRELARHLDVPNDRVLEAMTASAAFTPGSIDVSPGDDGEQDRSSVLAERDRGLDRAEDRLTVESLVQVLPEREAEIVRLRFHEDLTQSEIAERMGMSQMHVSRLLRKSFAIMRDAHRSAGTGR